MHASKTGSKKRGPLGNAWHRLKARIDRAAAHLLILPAFQRAAGGAALILAVVLPAVGCGGPVPLALAFVAAALLLAYWEQKHRPPTAG